MSSRMRTMAAGARPFNWPFGKVDPGLKNLGIVPLACAGGDPALPASCTSTTWCLPRMPT